MNLIETQGLTRAFGRAEAVRDLDLAVPAGSVTALLGPNGAGKSTTIRLLLNLLAPTRGHARVLGADSRRLGPSEFARIGHVSEAQELPLWMTVRGFLDFCRPLYPRWDRDLERTLLARLDLPTDRRLRDLSRGMRMKAALLSSLAYRPELLVLDEPFAGLDPLVREEFVRGILEVSGLGDWTVFISSHDIEEVERFCDRVVLLDAGRKRVDESTEALQARFRRLELTLAPGDDAARPAPADWLEREHSGRLLRFVTADYRADETERACAALHPGAEIATRPLALREIFLVLARAHRAETRTAALAS
jgi:ABC-2 type transport system ATP-binding protein